MLVISIFVSCMPHPEIRILYHRINNNNFFHEFSLMMKAELLKRLIKNIYGNVFFSIGFFRLDNIFFSANKTVHIKVFLECGKVHPKQTPPPQEVTRFASWKCPSRAKVFSRKIPPQENSPRIVENVFHNYNLFLLSSDFARLGVICV